MVRPSTPSWDEHEWPAGLAAQLATHIAVSVQQGLGLSLSPGDVETLFRAVPAQCENFSKMPALPASRDALRELIKLSDKLSTAMKNVYSLADEDPPLNSLSLVDWFLWESSVVLGDPSRVRITTDALIHRISHDLHDLTERAHRILEDAPLPSRGTSPKDCRVQHFRGRLPSSS